MKIGGLQKCSLIDYPGKICAIIFTIGCNFRCPYCHNPELVEETSSTLDPEEVLTFLQRRKNVLDAVTITGGEPTLHDDLPILVKSIKELGYLVKLDTNGTNLEMLKYLTEEKLIDYVAMDIKSPLDGYSQTVGRPVDTKQIKASIDYLISGDVPYEFRTTVVKSLLPVESFAKIGEEIRGAHRYYLQKFIPTKTLNPAFLRKTTYTDSELLDIKSIMESYVTECLIR